MTAMVPDFKPSAAARCLERRAGRVPEPRFGIVGVGREARDLASHDEPAPAHRVRLAFRRMAPVHHRVRPVEAALEAADRSASNWSEAG